MVVVIARDKPTLAKSLNSTYLQSLNVVKLNLVSSLEILGGYFFEYLTASRPAGTHRPGPSQPEHINNVIDGQSYQPTPGIGD